MESGSSGCLDRTWSFRSKSAPNFLGHTGQVCRWVEWTRMICLYKLAELLNRFWQKSQHALSPSWWGLDGRIGPATGGYRLHLLFLRGLSATRTCLSEPCTRQYGADVCRFYNIPTTWQIRLLIFLVSNNIFYPSNKVEPMISIVTKQIFFCKIPNRWLPFDRAKIYFTLTYKNLTLNSVRGNAYQNFWILLGIYSPIDKTKKKSFIWRLTFQ
jgi:hypothetical protein